MIKPDNTFVALSQHRVLYADTDAMGIVYNGAYFRFFERARDEYLRQRGLPYSGIEAKGYFTPLTEAYAHYYQSFKYDEVISMECWISSVKRASFRFDYRLFLSETPDETRVSGYTTLAVMDKSTNKVCKIPDWMVELLS
ncbi:acyl-CoA thioesterase [Deltaproteobacteria bacterium OttesenSCG-928-K17]|nr:acyl-CoA thioesterase [Deltaproteobacteria bacterium OttesenSCG-928-K17]